MNKRLLVTIGIAAFNEAASIRQALQCLCAAVEESGIACEFIVIASGCTDETVLEARGVLAQFSCGYYKIVEEQTRSGKSCALNTIVSLARGDIVVFCDADAIASHNAIRDIWNVFAKEPSLGAVFARTVSLQGRSKWWSYVGARSTSALHSLRALPNGAGLWMVSGHLYAIRRSTWHPIPHNTIADDCYIGASISQRGGKVLYLPDVTVSIRYPQTLADYLRQKLRNRLGRRQLLRREMGLPAKPEWLGVTAIRELGWRGRQHCLIAVLDTLLVLIAKCLWAIGYRQHSRWAPINSSKLYRSPLD